MKPISKEKINQYILYIHDSINELKINHRKDVLQIILGSDIQDSKISEKGNGTQIKFSDIPPPLLQIIYNFIHSKIESYENIIL